MTTPSDSRMAGKEPSHPVMLEMARVIRVLRSSQSCIARCISVIPPCHGFAQLRWFIPHFGRSKASATGMNALAARLPHAHGAVVLDVLPDLVRDVFTPPTLDEPEREIEPGRDAT